MGQESGLDFYSIEMVYTFLEISFLSEYKNVS